jgi:MFS family permease
MAFDLRGIFVFNGLTKVADIAIVVFTVRESRPERASSPTSEPGADRWVMARSMFANRAFLVIGLVAFAISVMSQGVFAALFPIYVTTERGLSTSDLGTLTAVAGFITALVLFPNGYLVDRFGRKSTLVPGLLILGVTALLLAISSNYAGLLLAVIVYGLGDGMCTGASQAYAMDLAPRERRGTFLGVWSIMNSSGSIAAPLLIGLAAQQLGFSPAFALLAAGLALVAVVTLVAGPNTHPRASRSAAGSSTGSTALATR